MSDFETRLFLQAWPGLRGHVYTINKLYSSHINTMGKVNLCINIDTTR